MDIHSSMAYSSQADLLITIKTFTFQFTRYTMAVNFHSIGTSSVSDSVGCISLLLILNLLDNL